LRSLGDDLVGEFAEFVSKLIRDREKRCPVLVGVDRDQAEAALGGLEEETQAANSVDAGRRGERDHETRALGR
jgi:hypothetical protein